MLCEPLCITDVTGVVSRVVSQLCDKYVEVLVPWAVGPCGLFIERHIQFYIFLQDSTIIHMSANIIRALCHLYDTHQGKRKVEIHGNNSLIGTITVNYLYYQITLIGTFWGGWSGNFTVISGNSVFIT